MIGILVAVAAFAAGDVRVLAPDTEPALMMTKYLNALANEALDRREAERESLKTAEDIARYQENMRRYFLGQLNLPDKKSPLNARVVGSGQKASYRYEKIIFESRPGFYVTGIVFLPLSEPPYPAVLVPCGHSANGKAMDTYQRVCIGLAQSGIAAFIYDPIGQGERYQILTDGKHPYESTIEHMFCGAGGILLGGGPAAYRIWDGMRAIDYLCERPDIDAKRIGCTGNSGGGTLTSYLMALDERIACAAPSCYLTSMRRLLVTAGPQDAEQDIHGQIAAGLDHSDYVMLRAPKPTLMCCATRDFFDIEGAWDSFRQAKRLYTKLGAPEMLNIAEANEEHGFTPPLRQAAVQWMRRFLLKSDETYIEKENEPLAEAEAQCTPEGQVLLMDGARSTFDIDEETAERFAATRREWLAKTDTSAVKRKIRELTGIRELKDIPKPEEKSQGLVARDGYEIDRIVLTPEPGIALPALLFSPKEPTPNAVIYVNGAGMAGDAEPGGKIEQLMRDRKCSVLAVDLRGMGETASSTIHKRYDENFGGGWQDYFRAYMLNKTYVGMWAEDIMACAKFFDDRPNPRRVHLIATGDACPAAMHVAALEPGLFDTVETRDGLKTWTDCVGKVCTPAPLVNMVHGALEWYDLADLERLK